MRQTRKSYVQAIVTPAAGTLLACKGNWTPSSPDGDIDISDFQTGFGDTPNGTLTDSLETRLLLGDKSAKLLYEKLSQSKDLIEKLPEWQRRRLAPEHWSQFDR